MLPYKIRKPAYDGSNKPKNKRASSKTTDCSGQPADVVKAQLFGNNDDDPRQYGGNLQRAILSDLLDLKNRFLQSNQQRSRKNDGSFKHGEPGRQFGHFKAAFKAARFGCIHNRAVPVPSRIDKGEFAQLIYSSCFYLLQLAFDEHRNQTNFHSDSLAANDTTNTSDELNAESPSFLTDAIFAIFALYTLHQTNTLPNDPYSTKITFNHPSIHNEPDLQRQWSHLPIGAGSKGQLFRRYYKLPVRIDRHSYLTLLHLRDECAAMVSRCNINLENDTNSLCDCSLAMDGMHIIDRMMDDDTFFAYCEYHGPCGLEGLAGNPVFYNAYYSDDGVKKPGSKRKRAEAIICNDSASRILTPDQLQTICPDNYKLNPLDLSSLSSLLDKHKSNLQSIQTKLQTSKLRHHQSNQLHPNDSDLKPRQRELVEKTLSGVWDHSNEVGTTTQKSYLDMIDILTGIATSTECMEKNLNGKQQNENLDVHSPTAEKCTSPSADSTSALPISLPETFSSQLRTNIRQSLSDFNKIVESVRQSVLKEKKQALATENRDYTNTTLDLDGTSVDFSMGVTAVRQSNKISTLDEESVLTGTGKEAVATLLSMSTRDNQQRKRRSKNIDDQDSTMSVSTGAGKQALGTLLRMSTRNNKQYLGPRTNGDDQASSACDELSVSTGAGKKALATLLSISAQGNQKRTKANRDLNDFWNLENDEIMPEGERIAGDVSYMSDGVDEFSVSTGAGKNALQSLLSLSGYDNLRKQKKRKGQTKQIGLKKNHLNIDDHDSSDDDSSSISDSSTEVGRHALQTLLTKVGGSDGPALRSKSKQKQPVAKVARKQSSPSKAASSKRTTQRTRRKTDLSQEDDDVSEATGGGKRALAALLSAV